MTIVKISTEVKLIALKTPFVTALRRVENIEYVRVTVLCNDSKIGMGEAPATMAITGEDIEIILESLHKIKDDLLGKSISQALGLLHSSSTIGFSAKAALDMAFVSLLSKEKDITLYKYFLKGKEPDEKLKILYTDVTISLNSKDKMLQDSRSALEDNMWILKIKLGEDIEHAIDVTKSISKELKEAKLLIDANQAWDLDSTLYYIDSIKDLDIELIEQPVIASDIKSLKKITQKSKINIMADESVFTLEDAREVIESGSADMINIKLMKCGGVSKAIEILEYAREKRIKCMLGSMLEGPISINVALHLAIAYMDVIEYVDLDSPLLYKEQSSELDFEFKGCEIFLSKHHYDFLK